MARVSLTVKNTPGSNPGTIAANGADFTWEAADSVNKNQYKLTGKELLLVRNDNVGAQTVTVTSVADTFNRTGDIAAYSVGIGEYAVFGPFDIAGWMQSDGYLYVEASADDVMFAVLKFA